VATTALEVEWVPLARVFLSPSNPRINDPAVPELAGSIRRFGWQQPIVAKRSGEVIAGNTRLKAAMSLGMELVPVVWFEGTDLEATAYQVADNRTHEKSSWDDQALAKILEHLREEDALEGVGFSDGEIEDLLARLDGELGHGDLDLEDQVPEPPDAATTRAGDLWVLGRHRLLCGDSSSWDDVERLLGGQPIHLVNMDPPYNVKVEPRSNNAIAAGLSSFAPAKQTHHQKLDLARHPGKAKGTTKQMRAKDRPLANDFISEAEFDRLLRAWFGNASRALLPGRGFYVWGGYGNLGNYPPALKESGLYFSQAIVWDKQHPVLTRKDFMGAFELAYYGWKEGAAHQYFGPNNATDLWAVKKLNHTAMVHLTEKPVELAARAMQYSSRKGENVLDLFGGSGSTMAGAEQTGRNAFLVEIDQPYCDVIVTRYQNLSGKKAVLEETTKSFDEVRAERLDPGASVEEVSS
jgi:DNA modification methylase